MSLRFALISTSLLYIISHIIVVTVGLYCNSADRDATWMLFATRLRSEFMSSRRCLWIHLYRRLDTVVRMRAVAVVTVVVATSVAYNSTNDMGANRWRRCQPAKGLWWCAYT